MHVVAHADGGRCFDQVRCNLFPSLAAFTAVVRDPNRMAAQRAHREPALADSYTMILRPSIYDLAYGDEVRDALDLGGPGPGRPS